MAFVCQEIKGLLTYLLKYLKTKTFYTFMIRLEAVVLETKGLVSSAFDFSVVDLQYRTAPSLMFCSLTSKRSFVSLPMQTAAAWRKQRD